MTLFAVLAWRPFIDGLDLHDEWWLLIFPLAVFVAIAYKAVRMDDLRGYWIQVAILAAQIVLGMIALGGVIYILMVWLLPNLVPMPGR